MKSLWACLPRPTGPCIRGKGGKGLGSLSGYVQEHCSWQALVGKGAGGGGLAWPAQGLGCRRHGGAAYVEACRSHLNVDGWGQALGAGGRRRVGVVSRARLQWVGSRRRASLMCAGSARAQGSGRAWPDHSLLTLPHPPWGTECRGRAAHRYQRLDHKWEHHPPGSGPGEQGAGQSHPICNLRSARQRSKPKAIWQL